MINSPKDVNKLNNSVTNVRFGEQQKNLVHTPSICASRRLDCGDTYEAIISLVYSCDSGQRPLHWNRIVLSKDDDVVDLQVSRGPLPLGGALQTIQIVG